MIGAQIAGAGAGTGDIAAAVACGNPDMAQKGDDAAGKLPGSILAHTCVQLGMKGEALQIMKDEYKQHSAIFLAYLSDPDLLTLKDDAHYKELVKKLNFPELGREVTQNALAIATNPR